MNERRDGGPIFPAVDGEHEFHPGLTIWDYYAGQALAGLATLFADPSTEGATTEQVCTTNAEIAANMADAMMAERERRGIGK